MFGFDLWKLQNKVGIMISNNMATFITYLQSQPSKLYELTIIKWQENPPCAFNLFWIQTMNECWIRLALFIATKWNRDLQGVYAKRGHSTSLAYLTFYFKTSIIVQQKKEFKIIIKNRREQFLNLSTFDVIILVRQAKDYMKVCSI